MLKFRAHNEQDKAILERFISADPEHSVTSSLEFWLLPENKHKGTDYLAVEDEKGVVVYLVLENCLRIHAQFAPATEIDRIRAAIPQISAKLAHDAKTSYRQLLFESVFPPLVRFLEKIGWRRSPNEVVLGL